MAADPHEDESGTDVLNMPEAKKSTGKPPRRLHPTFPRCTSCNGMGRFIASGERYSVACPACEGVGVSPPRAGRSRTGNTGEEAGGGA